MILALLAAAALAQGPVEDRRERLIGVSDSMDVGVVDRCHGEPKTVKPKPKGRR